MTGRAPDGTGLAPLPVLFIVVDEFSELLSQHPDFTDLFIAIGRLGRSLGMHLLLASQRLDEGRLRGLESHLSYRICLKTFSTGESRSVLGVPDAYHLPSAPGAAYLKTGSGEPLRFQTAFVSGPVRLAHPVPRAHRTADPEDVHRGADGPHHVSRTSSRPTTPPAPAEPCSTPSSINSRAVGRPRIRCGCLR